MESIRSDHRCIVPTIQLDHVEMSNQFQRLRVMQDLAVHPVAAGTILLLEKYGQRFGRGGLVQVEGRFGKERLRIQYPLRGRRVKLGVIFRESHLPFLFFTHIFQRREKLVRRVITVDAQNDFTLFVHQQYGGREPDLEFCGKLFFRQLIAGKTGYLPVTPDIQFDGIEVPAGEIHDVWLAEIGIEQCCAVRAAILAKI